MAKYNRYQKTLKKIIKNDDGNVNRVSKGVTSKGEEIVIIRVVANSPLRQVYYKIDKYGAINDTPWKRNVRAHIDPVPPQPPIVTSPKREKRK